VVGRGATIFHVLLSQMTGRERSQVRKRRLL
jgi:hypothetical protein